jgi:hypothetical protein
LPVPRKPSNHGKPRSLEHQAESCEAAFRMLSLERVRISGRSDLKESAQQSVWRRADCRWDYCPFRRRPETGAKYASRPIMW